MVDSAVNEKARHLQSQIQALEKEEDRRLITENAKKQIDDQSKFRRRYDTFEDNRDMVMSRHYAEVILPKIRQQSREAEVI